LPIAVSLESIARAGICHRNACCSKIVPEFVLDEGADRTATGTTHPSQFFEPSEDLRQPRFQQCAFDLSDIPVQDQKRGSTDVVDREECRGRGVVVGAGLGGCVDDREDGVASGWKEKRLVLNEELLAAEECDARPIDELGEILLGVDQRIVFPAQIFVKQPLSSLFLRGSMQRSAARWT
jgi:hypothetical protein